MLRLLAPALLLLLVLPACKTLPERASASRTSDNRSGGAQSSGQAPSSGTASADSIPSGKKPFLTQEGVASWYGGRWIGRKTANGERYRADDFTAAHRSLPFHTRVRVTDLRTGKSVVVRINNRGPYIRGRIIDISVAAAKKLGFYHRGLTRVRIEAFRPES